MYDCGWNKLIEKRPISSRAFTPRVSKTISKSQSDCKIVGEGVSAESEIFILKEYDGDGDVVPEHAHHILQRGGWSLKAEDRASLKT